MMFHVPGMHHPQVALLYEEIRRLQEENLRWDGSQRG